MKQETNHVWAPTGFGVDDMGESLNALGLQSIFLF